MQRLCHSHELLRNARDTALAEVAKLTVERDKLAKDLRYEESAHEDTIRHRDFCEEWADKLANAVAGVEVIGEHSNLNNPWEQAYDVMRSLEEFLAIEKQLEEFKRQVGQLNSGVLTAERKCERLTDDLAKAESTVAEMKEELKGVRQRLGSAEKLLREIAYHGDSGNGVTESELRNYAKDYYWWMKSSARKLLDSFAHHDAGIPK